MSFPDWHPLGGQSGVVLGFGVRHPRGLLLFDTGVGVGNDFIDAQYQPVRRSIDDALAAHGHVVGDVTDIVCSHLHFDHCGGNARFPGVPIHVQRVEHELAHEPFHTVPEWVDFEGAEYRLLDGDADIRTGVRVLATPGHTAGHQSVVLDVGDDGPIVLAGQAVYSVDELAHVAAHGTVPPGDAPPDPDAYLASAQRLLTLSPRRIHLSHDTESWPAR